MSLLQKASIITTPTAYAEDYLYSIKPAYALGSELVTNGDGSSTTGWNVAYANTTLSINNNNLRATANASGAYGLSQSLSLDTSKKYIITADINVDNASGGTANLRIATNVNLSASATTLSTATGTITTTFTSTASTMYIGIVDTANSSSNYVEINNISVKEVTDADFDFDRNSTGTRVNEDYLIEDVPYNLFSYSEAFTNSYWSKTNQGGGAVPIVTANYAASPYGAIDATRVQFDAVGTSSGDRSGLVRSFAYTSGTTYTISCWVKSTSGNNQVVQFRIAGAQVSTELTATNRWQHLKATYTATSSTTDSFGMQIRGNNSSNESDLLLWGMQLVKGDQPKDYLKTTDRLDIPRIDYTNGEPSILLEPSRTNLETKSNEFSTWSSNSNITRTADYIISPDGTQNATRLQFTANGFCSNKTQSLGTYTMSCYAKRNDSGTQNVGFFTNGSGVVNSAWEITSEWKRFSYAFPALNAGSMGIAGVSGADISVYGFQLEGLVSYATSYIPTSGSAVTRSADAANNAGNSDLINSTEGVLYAEIASLTTSNDDERTISLSDGTNINTVRLQFNSLTNNIRVFVGDGSTQANMNTTITDITDFNKLAFKYKVNDFALWINGVEVLTDTSGTTFSSGTLNKLGFVRGDNSEYFYGNIKSVMVFKEALTDLELEKLTGYNNHELYMNYYNRLSYLGLAEEYNVESDINNYIL